MPFWRPDTSFSRHYEDHPPGGDLQLGNQAAWALLGGSWVHIVTGRRTVVITYIRGHNKVFNYP